MQRDDQFPLAPYTDTLNFDHLSPFNKQLLKKHCPSDYKNKRYRSRKLLATFYPRRKYVVLLDNLKYYLRRGLKLTKIRRAVKFEQKDFLKNFITKITKLRSEAKTDFELRLFKLFANSTFGKFIGKKSNGSYFSFSINVLFILFYFILFYFILFFFFLQRTREITLKSSCATMKRN